MRGWHLNIPYITEESAKGNVWSSRWVHLSLSLECSRSSPLPESRLCHSLKCHSEQHIQWVIMIMWDLIQNKLCIMDLCDTKSSIRRISTIRNVMQHNILFAMIKLIIKLFAILSILPGLMLSLPDALKDEHCSPCHPTNFARRSKKCHSTLLASVWAASYHLHPLLISHIWGCVSLTGGPWPECVVLTGWAKQLGDSLRSRWSLCATRRLHATWHMSWLTSISTPQPPSVQGSMTHYTSQCADTRHTGGDSMSSR